MIALSGDRIIAAGLITATLALAACGSVNTVGTRSAPSTDVVSPLQSRINDALTDLYLHCTGARMSRTHGGPLQAQVDVANNDFRYRNFAYRFTWLGPNGNTIAWPMSVWKPAVIASGGSMTLISIAPTDAARDFSLEIRRSD